MMDLREILVRLGRGGSGSGSCSAAVFRISGVKRSGSATTGLV